MGDVRWQLVRQYTDMAYTGAGVKVSGQTLEFAGNTATVKPKDHLAAALTRDGVTFLRDNTEVGNTNLVSFFPYGSAGLDYISGRKSGAVAFSADGNRAYIAGAQSIYVIDLVTFKVVQTVSPPIDGNIASIVVAGNYLMIGEGGEVSASGRQSTARLMAIDIDPASSDFGKLLRLQASGVGSMPWGVMGMAVGPDGRTLVVTAPQSRALTQYTMTNGAQTPGDVYVFDLGSLSKKTGKIDAPIKATFEGGRGRTPSSVTATSDANRFLVTSLNDYNGGLGALTLLRDDQGKLASAEVKSIDLSQPDRMVGNYRLNIQSAQSAVLVTVDGVEYAIVADANFPFADPYVRAMHEAPSAAYTTYPGPFGLNGGPPTLSGGSLSAKQVEAGGKLGLVRDPFGKLGAPKFLGATAPQDGIEFRNLSLTDSGKVLLAQQYGAFGVNGLLQTAPRPNSQAVWDVQSMIVNANAQAGDLSTPLASTASAAIGGVTTTGGISTAGQTKWVDAEFTGRMGDVLKIDLKEVIARKELGWPAIDEKMTKLPDYDGAALKRKIDELDLGRFELLAGFDLAGWTTALNANGFQLVTRTANGARYIVSTDEANQASFATDGVLYVVPNITSTVPAGSMGMSDIDILRRGVQTLEDKFGRLMFTFTQKGESRSLNLEVNAKDYERGNSVFVGDRFRDNPGYSEFTLSGSIGINTTNKNNIIDIYRVEQRLKYLGFPAMGAKDASGANPSLTNNKIQDFKVDGTWGDSEARAAYFFYKVVNYGSATGTTLANRPGKNQALDSVRRTTYFNNLQTAATTFSFSNGGADQVVKYLSAFNAPHWKQLFASGQSAGGPLGWTTNQISNTGGSVERFGTSWMLDLMTAAGQNAAGFRGAQYNLRLTGAVDANHGYSPFGHSSHDLGMAFDLGLTSDYVSVNNQLNANEPNTVAASNLGWSIVNARDQLLPANGLVETANYFSPGSTVGRGSNRQRSALGAFLSVYAITRNDKVGGAPVAGSLGSLNFVNAGGDADFVRKALFRTGNANDGLISGVLVGGTGAANPLSSIGQVLTNLGFGSTTTTAAATVGHENHFHIRLRPPEAELIRPRSLNASSFASDRTFDARSQDGNAMLIDFYTPPEQDMTTVVVQQQFVKKSTKPIFSTVCSIVADEKPAPSFNNFNPVSEKIAKALGLSSSWAGVSSDFYEITVLEQPRYGTIVRVPPEGSLEVPIWQYEVNNQGYNGRDKAIFLIKARGLEFHSAVTFNSEKAIPNGHEEIDALYRKLCASGKSPTGPGESIWAEFAEVESGKLAEWFRSVQLSGVLSMASDVTYSFSALPGTTVGNTSGTGLSAQITLDTDAAGHGWYVDATPLDNTDDYLPTSDPNVWQAKPGSAAAGKMDMLSVLLHEYGHALGLDHSGDGHDFMAESLQPGQRKLPSADELSLMAQLVAQLKGEDSNSPSAPGLPAFPSGIALAGLLGARRRPEDTDDSGNAATQSLHKLLSVNPALQNTEFSQGSTQGWSVDGAVSAAGNGAAITLAETTTAQTTLSQAFTLGEDDRFLSFTVDGLQLNGSTGTTPAGQHNAPADAFEVALLDAVSYDPLLGNLGLTRSDALLNLQHDASGALAQRQGTGVYTTRNTDGSTTYTLDLRSLNAGRSVLLSFDLLGFGAADSAVTLRDIHLSRAAQALDDMVSVAEDTATTIQALANDLGVAPAGEGGDMPTVVSGPSHGSVSINADGSFLYTPNANYNGPDSFSYRIASAGAGEGGEGASSNTATVHIEVTPVDDGLTAHAVEQQGSEDTPLTLNLLANVLDVDGDTLSVSVPSSGEGAPRHGSVTVHADGRVTYTPDADYAGADSFG